MPRAGTWGRGVPDGRTLVMTTFAGCQLSARWGLICWDILMSVPAAAQVVLQLNDLAARLGSVSPARWTGTSALLHGICTPQDLVTLLEPGLRNGLVTQQMLTEIAAKLRLYVAVEPEEIP